MSDFLIGGLSAEAVYDRITAAGVSKYEASQLVGEWILAKQKAQSRVFDYSTPLDAIDPDCVPRFNRSFHHIDWVDGESTVQAGKTVSEDGFNGRLHQIEADLDAASADAATAISCLADLRAQFVQLLGEVKLELNRINADLQALSPGRLPPVAGTGLGTVTGATFVGSGLVKGQNVDVWQTSGGLVTLPSPAPRVTDPVVNPAVLKAPELAMLFARQPELNRTVASGAKVSDVVSKFGGLTSPGGLTLTDLLSTFPGSATFPSTAEAVTQLGSHDAITVVARSTKDAVFATTFASTGMVTDPASVSIADLNDLTPAEKSALLASGLATVAKMVEAGPGGVQQAFEKSGLVLAPGRADSIVARLSVVQLVAGLGQ
jgi:hypothetical protein